MWILYASITVAIFSISNGFYGGSVGSAFVTLVIVGVICASLYSIYPYTPQGLMMESVKKDIDKEYIEHRNSLFSKNNRNVITYCIVFYLFILSFRITKFIRMLTDHNYFGSRTHLSIIVLIIGIVIMLGFLRKYKTLPRSEKRELEFMDAASEIAFSDKIDEYIEQQKLNPQYHNVTYLGGYHKKSKVNVLGTLKIDNDILSMYLTYYEKTVFEIPISEIIDIKYEQIEDDSYSRSFYYYVNLMYIHYISDGEKYMLRFKLGRRVKFELENRIKEINKDRVPPQTKPEHQDRAMLEEIKKPHDEQPSDEIKEAIEQKYESIEERLERLKYFMNKDLITEQEYKNRKQEILDEI